MQNDIIFCDRCGCELTRDSARHFEGDYFCSECFDEATVVCNHCGERVWSENNAGTLSMPLCERCYDDHYICCEDCGRLIHRNYANYYDDDDYAYCDVCFSRHKDYDEAVHYFTTAQREVENKDEIDSEKYNEILYYLGRCYYYGNGVTRDRDLAYKMFIRSHTTVADSNKFLVKIYNEGCVGKRDIVNAMIHLDLYRKTYKEANGIYPPIYEDKDLLVVVLDNKLRDIELLEKTESNFCYYRGFPLFRNGNEMYYGNMGDKYIAKLTIRKTAKLHGEEVPTKVTVQLVPTGTEAVDLTKIRKGEMSSLYKALDTVHVWLSRELL